MPGNLLSSSFRCMFEDSMSPSQQQQAIDSLQDYIHEVQYGTDDQRRDLGIIDDDDEDPEVISRKLAACLEKCYWQLVMFLKSAKPSLISSAEPYLRYLLESNSLKNDSTHVLEVTALLHLAAALAAPAPALASQASSPAPLGLCTPSTSATSSFHHEYACHGLPPCSRGSVSTRDEEALAMFNRAFALYDLVSRSRGSSPSPSPSPRRGALGLDVSPRASPVLAPTSPTFAYTCATSPCGALDSPRASRLSGICGRKGKLPAKTELWARASYVRLLRRLAFCEDEDQAEAHLMEADAQLAKMRSYIRENPYALPHEKYEPYLAELSREFDIVLPLAGDVPEDALGDQPSLSRAFTPSATPLSESCSSSSSESASPQTPYTPLSPVAGLSRVLHEREETKRPMASVTAALGRLTIAKHDPEVEHHEHVAPSVAH
ncbi:hypothetical protein PsYK624_123460 [Phanerochaete sordida]|uniref:Uncharacterized protein n=1 Tax=Phanerochaete sordida TaxID=48140 RepID=A0A9P3GHP0_9APHY|nr:hypothetical protein PsYK624_123460 [Phanerochaete sordida]